MFPSFINKKIQAKIMFKIAKNATIYSPHSKRYWGHVQKACVSALRADL
jgi:hypothetical protein